MADSCCDPINGNPINNALLKLTTVLNTWVSTPPNSQNIAYVDYLALTEKLKDCALKKINEIEKLPCTSCTGLAANLVVLIFQVYYYLLSSLINDNLSYQTYLELYPQLLNFIVTQSTTPCCTGILTAFNYFFSFILKFLQTVNQSSFAQEGCNTTFPDIINTLLKALCIISKKGTPDCCAAAAFAVAKVSLGYLSIRIGLLINLGSTPTLFCEQLAIDIDNYYEIIGLIVNSSKKPCISCCTDVYNTLGFALYNPTVTPYSCPPCPTPFPPNFDPSPPRPPCVNVCDTNGCSQVPCPTITYPDLSSLYNPSIIYGINLTQDNYLVFIDGIRKVTMCLVKQYKKILYQTTSLADCPCATKGLRSVTYQFALDALNVMNQLQAVSPPLDADEISEEFYNFLSEYSRLTCLILKQVQPVFNPDCQPCDQAPPAEAKVAEAKAPSPKVASPKVESTGSTTSGSAVAPPPPAVVVPKKGGCACGH